MFRIRRASALAFPLLLAACANAQALLGPKAGVNLATMHASEDPQPEETLPGPVAGIQLEVPLSSSVLFAPELIFQQKGMHEKESTPFISVESKLFLNYLEIPLLLKFATGRPEGVRALFTLGASPGFLMTGKTNYKVTTFGVTQEFTQGLDFEHEEISRFDVGACAGAGIGIPVSFGAIRLEGRYQLGLIDLDTSDDDFQLTNRGIQIALAVLFDPTKKPAKATKPAPAP